MKGIMRKRLLSLLSVVGLASSSTPAWGQVLKGSQAANTKSQSTIKASKAAQEDAASKDAMKLKKAENERKAGGVQQEAKHKIVKAEHESDAAAARAKIKRTSAEGGHATSDVLAQKQRKAGGEQNATNLEHKHKQASAEKAAVGPELAHKKASATGGGGGAGKVAMQDVHIKSEKSAGELNAARQDANKKAKKQVDQASPK